MSQPCLASAYAGRELRASSLVLGGSWGNLVACWLARSNGVKLAFTKHTHDVAGPRRVSHAENSRAGPRRLGRLIGLFRLAGLGALSTGHGGGVDGYAAWTSPVQPEILPSLLLKRACGDAIAQKHVTERVSCACQHKYYLIPGRMTAFFPSQGNIRNTIRTP